MDFKIVDKPGFKVFGKSIQANMGGNEHLLAIPQFWRDCDEDGYLKKLTAFAEHSTLFPKSKIGMCYDPCVHPDYFTYVIGAEGDESEVDGVSVYPVPAAQWAVFESKGLMPESIQAVWQSIYADFFPNSEYKQGSGPEMEIYPAGNISASDYVCEVWIPVVLK